MLNSLDDFGDVGVENLAVLDETYSFTGTQNAETAFAWYMQAIKGSYDPAMPELENFLMTVGRGKFIYRLYGALNDNGKAAWAKEVYAKARPAFNLLSISFRAVDNIVGPGVRRDNRQSPPSLGRDGLCRNGQPLQSDACRLCGLSGRGSSQQHGPRHRQAQLGHSYHM